MHVALDTSGSVSWERYKQVLPLVDLVLLDLKLIDPKRHQSATGLPNEIILENACRIAAEGKSLWIRTPIIPAYTDDLENIRSIGDFIKGSLPTVQRWDLLAYTNLGQPKYHRLDRSYVLEKESLLTRAEMEILHQAALDRVPTAKWSGATR